MEFLSGDGSECWLSNAVAGWLGGWYVVYRLAYQTCVSQ